MFSFDRDQSSKLTNSLWDIQLVLDVDDYCVSFIRLDQWSYALAYFRVDAHLETSH
jgi:hypothetical protein